MHKTENDKTYKKCDENKNDIDQYNANKIIDLII